ncbi:serine/threonine-protein kinase [Tsukamurella sp. NPDC003166]|uniref:serine/threonine-protein kinase n=1 Tax=Tsukamurella sp. NPDC003166 TaxID=3154444 RepID=UPI0033AE87F1
MERSPRAQLRSKTASSDERYGLRDGQLWSLLCTGGTAVALEPGAEFAGYVIERLLGAGGMGEVYVARHPRLPRSDALKVLLPQFAADPAFRARFEREADLAAGLVHPAIVRVYDRGEFDGHLWIAMELVDGEDLAHLVRSRGSLDATLTARVVTEAAAALDAANSTGLVHRDVKPANILMSTTGRVLLSDFGIARMGAESSDLTGTGVTVGTLNYASPEQLRGLPLDGRSDQYSLGCTAFQLLNGSAPYASTNAATVMAGHLGEPLPSVRTLRPGLPAAVDAALARATAKSPADRYPSSGAFAADLAEALSHADESAPAVGPVSADTDRTVVRGEYPASAPTVVPRAHGRTGEPARSRRRGPITAGVAIVAVIALIVGVAVVIGNRGKDSGDDAVSSEAATLTPILATPLMPSLNGAPAQSRWTFQGFQGGGSRLLAADDKRVLVTYRASSSAAGE